MRAQRDDDGSPRARKVEAINRGAKFKVALGSISTRSNGNIRLIGSGARATSSRCVYKHLAQRRHRCVKAHVWLRVYTPISREEQTNSSYFVVLALFPERPIMNYFFHCLAGP